MEHWEKKANGWVFISHSSEDYEAVKIVRNYLEENGFSALMFYLKSFEGADDKKIKLAEDLIKWEIEARNIFVLCNSHHASKSPWVQNEIKYVKKFPEKIYKEIDIEKLKYEKCTQLSKLDKLMVKATLFFSYSYLDKEIIDKISYSLSSNGFKVWIDSNDLKAGDNFAKQINNAILEASKTGTILIFLSKNSLASEWMNKEIEMIVSLNAYFIPIIIDKDVDIFDFRILMSRQFLDITKGSFEKNMKKLLNALKMLVI
jgi:hypothetical protein